MIEYKLFKYQNLVNREMKIFLKNNIKNNYSPWNEKFNKELFNFIMRGGKRLRPVLSTIIYEGTGGKDILSMVKISLAAEILHNSTLIHDDLIDNSSTRRGKNAFHKLFENWLLEENVDNAKSGAEAMAILGGDFLIFLSFKTVLESNFPDIKKLYVINAIRDVSEMVIRGQILDTELSIRNGTEDEYLKLIDGKTASAFESITRVATFLSDAEGHISDSLGKYANKIGCAFQIQDDILGVFGKQKELGKPTTSDLAEGKKTILVIKAYELANSNQKRILDKIVGNKKVTEKDVEIVKAILRDTGALDYSINLASSFIDDSLDLLKEAKDHIKNDSYKILDKLPQHMLKRKY